MHSSTTQLVVAINTQPSSFFENNLSVVDLPSPWPVLPPPRGCVQSVSARAVATPFPPMDRGRVVGSEHWIFVDYLGEKASKTDSCTSSRQCVRWV